MERLTYRDWSGDTYPRTVEQLIVNKLADYEDTGYTPEQIKKMAKEIRELKEDIAGYEWREELRYETELGEDI